MFKRAWLSVVRKKVKTGVLLILLFIIANLVLSSIAIKNATKEAMAFARQSLGSEVSLTVDMDKIRSEMQTTTGSDTSIQPGSEAMDSIREKMMSANINYSDVEKIAAIKYVADVKYGFTNSAEPVSFDLVEATTTTNNDFGGRGPAMSNSLTVEAINTFDLLSSYKSGTIKLLEGNSFDETVDKPVIISYELATQNSLKLNDTMTVTATDGDEVTYTIVGIFQNTEETTGNPMFSRSANTLYTNISGGLLLMTDENYNNGNYKVNSATFYLDDPKNIDTFKTEANKIITDLADRNLKLDVNDSAYQSMIGAISGVGQFSNTILIIVIIGAVVIISLMILNAVKDRNYEFGVLLSLGERKRKIIGQVLVELLIIATAAFSMSLLTSNIVSQKLGDSILANQLSSAKSNNNNVPGGNRGSMNNRFPGGNENSNVEAIDELSVKVSGTDIGLLYLVGYVIIIVSMTVPTINILRCDPKDILSRKDG